MRSAGLAALRLLAGRFPGAGQRLARAVAALTRPRSVTAEEERLARTFPRLGPEALLAARRSAWSTYLQGEALRASLRRAPEPYPPLVPNPDVVAAARGPVIFVSFHVGPFEAIGALLEALPGAPVILHREPTPLRPGLTLVRTGEDQWQRTRALMRAAAELRSGGIVWIVADTFASEAAETATLDVPLLGAELGMARGPFALARIAGAPVVPVAARWSGLEVELVCGAPIAPSADERTMALAAAGWLEDYLRAFPGEAGAFLMARLRPPSAP